MKNHAAAPVSVTQNHLGRPSFPGSQKSLQAAPQAPQKGDPEGLPTGILARLILLQDKGIIPFCNVLILKTLAGSACKVILRFMPK